MRTDLSSAFLRAHHKKQGGWAGWASLAGGVLGAMNSGGSGGSTTSSSSPWWGQEPSLHMGYANAQGLLERGHNPQTEAMLRARGMSGSPVTQGANNLAGATLRGDYLNSNPFTEGAVKDAMGMARSQINSQFGGGSNFGSSAHQEWLGRGLMNAALPALNQNYENERGRQFAALSQAPALAGLDYQDINAVQQADFMPWNWLNQYTQNISGLPAGGGSQTTPYFTNPVNSALGGALLGNQLYNSYTKNNQPASNQWADWGNMGSSTPFTQSGFADL